jgi:anaerobic ribonucleoside-triphosphate reductase activating protein
VIRLFGTADDSIVDGPGMRLAIFVQGCSHACPGCHNPKAQPAGGGRLVSAGDLLADVLANPLLAGITLTGGEPFEQAAALVPLAAAVRGREVRGRRLTVWAYSGYTFEQLLAGVPSEAAPELLRHCDVLVDGRYVEEQRSPELPWRGSANQRLIDVPASLAAGEAVLAG